ncbi:MAG: hypothetical protein P1P88_05970 [Bacteroidales bacterium]|nr:hypothetical protein [Bacteroidales bacterium]
MKNAIFFLLAIILVSCNVQKRAVSQAEKLAEAMRAHQYELTLSYTHPKVIEMLGGNKKYLEILTTGGKEMKKMGISYESIALGEPSKPLKAGKELHCLIPETITMLLKEDKMVSKSHLLAVSKDNGKRWTFIETAVLNEENIKKILPNYNPELKIPEQEEPMFIK